MTPKCTLIFRCVNKPKSGVILIQSSRKFRSASITGWFRWHLRSAFIIAEAESPVLVIPLAVQPPRAFYTGA
jgi:hypothetical protein